MFQICLCDDNTKFVSILIDKINRIALKNNLNINILSYSSGKSLMFDLEEIKYKADIYFLDVCMDDYNGIQIANSIRKFNIFSPIIFLTSIKEHVFEALDTMPLHYLIKQDLKDDKLEEIFIKAINLISNKKKKLFHYKVGHTLKSIDTSEIVYFEIKNRIVTLNCVNNYNESFYSSLKNLIDCNDFIQIHRSFLVNKAYIRSIDTKDLITSNNIKLPIGSKYIKNLKISYKNFLLNYEINSF